MKVTWTMLALRGFGLYRDEVRVILGEGMNTLIARNEQGKSTLVAGLGAVIFGLPGSNDPEQFGQTRFRNWHGSSRFEGEIEFIAGGTRYRIERNFTNHRVRLLRESPGRDNEKRWIEEVTGTHNPSAQRRNEAYENRLRELLAVSSREIFEATFCVVQPLPEARQMDHRVQQLLSGAGGEHFRTALAALAESLKFLTRRTGDLGVTARNGRVDGELERLEARRAALEEQLRSSRNAIDSLQVVQTRLDEARQRVSQASDELKLKQDLLRAWEDWRRLAERRRAAIRDQSQTQAAYSRAAGIAGEIEERQRSLARDFPEYVNAGVDTGDRLETLAEVEQQITDITDQIRTIDASLADQGHGRRPVMALVIGVILALLTGIIGVIAFAPWLGVLIGLLGGIIGSLLGWLLGEWRGSNGKPRAAAARLQAIRTEAGIRLEEALRRKRELVQPAPDSLAPILGAAGGDIKEARRRYKDWSRRREEVVRLRDTLDGLLKGQNVATVDELNERLLGLANAALAAQTQLEALADLHPGLPSPDMGNDPVALEERYRLLNAEVQRLRAAMASAEEEIRGLVEEQARLQGRDPLNIAVAEAHLAEINQERSRLGQEVEALALAHRELALAVEDYQASHRDRLSRAAGNHFSRLTGRGGRQVLLDEAFSFSVREPDGRVVSPGQLSRGAQDQLYLSLRLAIADLMAEEVNLPFIFDDPFLNFDNDRLARMRQALESLAGDRQVVLLSHRDDLAAWGQPVEVEAKL